MIDLINDRLKYIKEVETSLFYSIERSKREVDTDVRIELYMAIKLLEKEYCSFVVI